ncbi:LysE family translocator [Phreatobacter cathodiphilus]|uniref:Lysine transporter LysE n=1 Tax=Phreatobacter cathodiphilus TaxID=1868589 RepID=A0A2S0NCD9_9HYPH|nr:LysE family translocator [Phreatobacter cathodiphilus]AVO45706.1 lysine transporter LysE [Phreatobacter cathodiphilus]
MHGIHDFWLFVLAGLLLNVTPGPDMALVMGRAMRDGARAGAVAALGIGAGAFVHIASAAVGLSVLIASSALAFTVVKWLGAAYLVVVGLRMLLATPAAGVMGATHLPPSSLRTVFLQGFLTNVLNPKVALFFLAFLPQFIDPAAPSKAAAFIALGLVFNLTGTGWNLAVAWAASRMARLSAFTAVRAWLDRVLGALFLGLGIRLALAER